jgi:phosphate transport system substrate-binding protein
MITLKSNKLNSVYSTGLLALVGAALAGCGGNNAATNSGSSAGGTNSAAGGSTASTGGSTSATGATGGATRLTGAGATFPGPIYSKWFSKYNQEKGVQINYQEVGSGAGIKQLTAQTVDFGATDVPVKDKDIAEMPSPIVHIPTVGGAVVLAYNLPDAPNKIKMTGADVAAIYLGKVKNWSDPAFAKTNPGIKLPSKNITVAQRSDGSGTTNIFTSFLSAVSPEWKAGPGTGKAVEWPVGLGGKGNAGVAAIIKSTPGAIGYVELAYAKQNKLNYALVQNKAGKYVEPSADSVSAAAKATEAALAKDVRAPIANAAAPDAYPIAGFTYILAYQKQKDAAKGTALKEMLKWAITDGQKEAEAMDYAPLPDAIVALNQKTIDSIS